MEVVAEDLKQPIKAYLAEEFFGGDDSELNNDTKLVSSGLLDSISTMQVIDFLEKEYDVEFFPQEMTPEYIDTIDLLAKSVEDKRK